MEENIDKPTWEGGVNNRPDWDTFFMSIAFLIAQRSVDPRTVHGAVLVAEDKRILSVGYNGPIRNSIDTNIPLYDKRKYMYVLHAEENLLLNYNGSKEDLKNSTLYVTGKLCHRCLRMVLQKGIKNIVCGPIRSFCKDEEDEEACANMVIGQNVNMREILDPDNVLKILNKTINYINYKLG